MYTSPSSAFGVVPFLKDILGRMLPMLGMAKHDNMKWVFANCESVEFSVLLGFEYYKWLSCSWCCRHGVLCTRVRQVNHLGVQDGQQDLNSFI